MAMLGPSWSLPWSRGAKAEMVLFTHRRTIILDPTCQIAPSGYLANTLDAATPSNSNAGSQPDDEAEENLPHAPSGSSDSNYDTQLWRFRTAASLGQQLRIGYPSEVIGDIAFNPSEDFFATVGISRKIRIYSLQAVLDAVPELADDDNGRSIDQSPEPESIPDVLDLDRTATTVICTPARLSSVQWSPENSTGAGIVGCGDYDGVVSEWDAERNIPITERDGHGGHKVWSIDYCRDMSRRNLCASASDDGSVHIWAGEQNAPAITLHVPARAAACSARFSPGCSNTVAVAAADAAIYVYDTRRAVGPLHVLRRHLRAVSNVRFLGPGRLVSASVDSTLCLWDVGDEPKAIRSFCAHLNVRNFVGLSLHNESGLLACGSETNEAYIYDHRSVSRPVASHSFKPKTPPPGLAHVRPFVSAVSWRQRLNSASEGCPAVATLLAANSDGFVDVLHAQYRFIKDDQGL